MNIHYNFKKTLNAKIFILLFCCVNITFSQTKHHLDKNQKIIIPISFHIVENNKERTDLQIKENHNFINNRIKLIIYKINEGFNSVKEFKIEPEYHNDIANCNIFFKLREVNGVTFHKTSEKSFLKTDNYDKLLKQNGYINSKENLNIWICNLLAPSNSFYGKKVAHGYSTFPTKKNTLNDGIVISREALLAKDFVFTNSNQIHEIGHWLGLHHIWGDNLFHKCNDEDGIDDTPNQKKPHKYKSEPYLYNEIQDVCFPLLTKHKKTNYQNFMDYSGVYGMFTKGQAIEMRNNIFKYRKGFLSNETSTTNLADYQNMTTENFNYYVISVNNLDYKNNDTYLSNYIKRIKKLRSKSEFELKKIKTEVVKEIENNINNLNTKYKKSNYVDFLREYNFNEHNFPFKINDILWDWRGSYLLKYLNGIEKSTSFNLSAVNANDFKNINLSEIEAENLINSTNQRRIYPQIEYTTLKLPIKNSKGNIVGMFAYVDRVKIFSDMQRTKLIYTLKNKSNKKGYEQYNYAVRSRINNQYSYEYY